MSMLCLTFLSLANLKAEDTTVVQVLTFDNIHTRDTIANFPDGSKDYRKILMYYRLKCDPKTPWDRFNCGEWDYLAYTTLHFPTGIMDSAEKHYTPYKVKGQVPKIIEIGTEPAYTTHQRYELTAQRSGEDSEVVDFTGETATEITLGEGENSFKYQFRYKKAEIKELGPKSMSITNLRFFAKTAGKIKNFKIRIGRPNQMDENNYILDKMETLFSKREVDFAEGMNEFVLNEVVKWTQLYNLTFEISGEKANDSDLPVLEGFEDTRGLMTNEANGYYEFDGMNDYVTGGERPNLAGISKMTFEAWVKIDQWKNWTNLITLGDKACIQTGNAEGQLYAIMRSKKDETSYNNLHGNVSSAITLEKWTHLALVFDGTKAQNKDKLLLYVNGNKQPLTFNGQIPNLTHIDPQELRIGQNKFNGGMDEVRIFNTALSETTINDMMVKSEQYILANHPNRENLVDYYSFDKIYGEDETTVLNVVTDDQFATKIGTPAFRKWDLSLNPIITAPTTATPKMQIQNGNYELTVTEEIYDEKIYEEIATIHTYILEDRKVAENKDAMRYAYLAGWRYTYSPEGEVVDSIYFEPAETLQNEAITYYKEPYEYIDNWEIARFITPYGINFDLGPDGFLWVYDVTDYAPFLKGDVSMTAHNTQELIDLKFLFIEGTPPRDVVAIDRVWEKKRYNNRDQLYVDKTYKYGQLREDILCPDTTMTLSEGTEQLKLISRLTGHRFRSGNSGPDCCEFTPNIHSMKVNQEEKRFDWLIWRDDCATNPVGHQGGTWTLAREGWCPGDLVRDTELELTDYIKDNQISLDYEVAPYFGDDTNMENGELVTTNHLIQYSETNFDKDVEIYQIISPNKWQTYANRALLCDQAQIVIRNNGKEPVNEIDFKYYVNGAEDFGDNFIWSGKLAPHTKDTISLPITDDRFWLGSTDPQFNVEIVEIDGSMDDYAVNDNAMAKFETPEMFNETIYFELLTNKRGADFSYSIKDIDGNYIFNRENLANETTYRDTINVKDIGFYTLELNDVRQYGLELWFVKEQGAGYLKIFNSKGQLLKSFDPDCGQGYLYPFNMNMEQASYVHDEGFDNLLTLSPMPCHNELFVDCHDMFGEFEIEVYDVYGKRMIKECAATSAGESISVDTSELPTGFYYITISNGETTLKQKFIKE
jgi:hypothetical protein